MVGRKLASGYRDTLTSVSTQQDVFVEWQPGE
jgi:hypothetical protein